MSNNKHKAIFLAVVMFLFPLAVNAVTITIYGKGGIRVYPPAICPEESQQKCAEIQFIEGSSSNEVTVLDANSTDQYRAIFDQPIPAEVTEMQGSELEIKSIEPIE
jgi:hypothetical protein